MFSCFLGFLLFGFSAIYLVYLVCLSGLSVCLSVCLSGLSVCLSVCTKLNKLGWEL